MNFVNKKEIEYYTKVKLLKTLLGIVPLTSVIAVLLVLTKKLASCFLDILKKPDTQTQYILIVILMGIFLLFVLFVLLRSSYINHLQSVIKDLTAKKEKTALEEAKERIIRINGMIQEKPIDFKNLPARDIIERGKGNINNE